VGGPKGGHWHLENSNVDWGQDLLFLKRWLDAHPEASGLGVAFGNNCDPKLAGIEYTHPPAGPDARSGEVVHREPAGPLPGWYAVGVDQLHLPSRRHSYFLQFEPVATAGYSIWIYHITLADANQVRLRLGLPALQPGADNFDTGELNDNGSRTP
jgi:hypothetical protein